MIMKNDIEILKESGCLNFVCEKAEKTLNKLLYARPGFAAMLTDKARDCLLQNCIKRLEIIYLPSIFHQLQDAAVEQDPIGFMTNRPDSAIQARVAQELAKNAEGRMDELLHTRYPLLEGYETHALKNFLASWTEFYDALEACRDGITERLLGGRPFTGLERFSDLGADQHRHGRAVTGVWTDVGAFYFKPHDCGLDVLYHEIVTRWFSDCTTAADVVEGDGVAFVSCLEQAPLESENGIRDYYYHFGVLTALLHGLGSLDMHEENIMPCGDRPTIIDIETIVTGKIREVSKKQNLESSRHVLGHTVFQIGVLPARMYRKPLLSPLYGTWTNGSCLPEFKGKRYCVEGHEECFRAGFREGYRRVLSCREEMKTLLHSRGGAAVRVLMRNTAFYAVIQQYLYRPGQLQSEEAQNACLHRLSVPFEMVGAEVFRAQVDFEAACLKQGDIPYFCAAMNQCDLCGETPDELVSRDYFAQSAEDTTCENLDMLSEEDLRFEEDLIRIAFDHAPLDALKDSGEEPFAEQPITPDDAIHCVRQIFLGLKYDAATTPDGNQMWISTAIILRGSRPFGDITTLAETGAFCAQLLHCKAMAQMHGEARILAGDCALKLEKMIHEIADSFVREDASLGRISLGLWNGLGGVLFCCGVMERACISGAAACAESILCFLYDHESLWHSDATVAEGLSGLVLALSSLPDGHADREACMRLCAKMLLEAKMPERPDLMVGAAGYAAALAAAFRATGDQRCADKELEALTVVRAGYDPSLRGWPDSEAKIKWLADRGTQAAGIALAASYALEWFRSADTKDLLDLALDSMANEAVLKYNDTLDEGNALTVMSLLRMGKTEQAGRVLEAMRLRAGRKGTFTVCPEGIRSFFDPSLWLGTPGIGSAAIAFLNSMGDGGIIL